MKRSTISIVLIVIVWLALSLNLQSCSCNTGSNNNIPEYDDTGYAVEEPRDTKEPVLSDTENSTTDINETNPDDTQIKDPADYPDYFEFNESSRIVGSIGDCERVEVSIGDKTFTLKEYFDDPKSYYAYFESYYKDSAIRYSPYVGVDENIGFCYYFDDKAQDESLFITMCDFGFEYGCEMAVPENLNLIDFSVNGVALGDGVEDVFDALGNPHDEFLLKNDYHSLDNYTVSYYFEESNPNVGWARDTVSFQIIDGKGSKILCVTYKYF